MDRMFKGMLGAAFCLASLPAFATYHPVIEGEFFSDFDATDAPASFNVYPAGIYEPVDSFLGSVNWSSDTSDTIVFGLGSPGAAGYALKQFRVGFLTEPAVAAGSHGLRFNLQAVGASVPVLNFDLPASSSGGAGYTDNTLRLVSGQLYALTLTSVGPQDTSATARYSIGFTVADPVPEPSTLMLFAAGTAILCATRLPRNRNSTSE